MKKKTFLSISMITMIVIINFYSGLLISNSSGISLKEIARIAFANAEDNCISNENCPDGMKCENGTCVWKTYSHIVNCTIEKMCVVFINGIPRWVLLDCEGYKESCTTDQGLHECSVPGIDICRGCDPCPTI